MKEVGKKVTAKKVVFYALGVLLIAGFIYLYWTRFTFSHITMPPPIRYLFYEQGPGWAIAANIGVFWLFLLFLPYRSKIEWRSKGAFAAFILALIAEMFGIPLLLYILSPLFHVSPVMRLPGLPPINWFNNPLLFGWLGMVIGTWMTLLGMILVIGGWIQIHGATGLVINGLYKHMRHPQYTGLFLVITGWVIHWQTTLTVVMYPVLLVMYFYLARQEEAALERKFGAEYVTYLQNTPMFLPIRWRTWRERT
jgi:protein-S-isoprenylcysteine O-methyltransferase Ste14